ncbi:hypothetical protein RRG08_062461 [Elysia crispata]|uniref:Uncharacterized protein n=1 Tax=Elysia crispata TaxID=231223 RepID=A0AAE1CJM5_9GAST|nr:hypothetical protein RRG08_062461 [Elysia crispata]
MIRRWVLLKYYKRSVCGAWRSSAFRPHSKLVPLQNNSLQVVSLPDQILHFFLPGHTTESFLYQATILHLFVCQAEFYMFCPTSTMPHSKLVSSQKYSLDLFLYQATF